VSGGALPGALLCGALGLASGVAGRVVGDRRVAIALRVVASWLIAVAVLGVALQLLPVIPGYVPDHLE
jgi:hypothetical protein